MKKICFNFFVVNILCTPFLTYGECIGDKTAKKLYSVYIVPQTAISQLYSHWVPLLEHLGKRSNQCFELIVPATIPVFEKQLLNGKADFAFVNPYHAVMAFKAHQYIPLIADGKNKLDGLIVVRADSNINKLKDLNHSKIAFPAPNAFAASLLIRSFLMQEGIVFEPIYVKSHKNAYWSVMTGDVPAGGGVNNTFFREPDEIKNQLRILYKTPMFMPHPFIANPRVPPNVQRAVQDAFLSMKKDPALAELLNNVQIPEPIAVDYRKDYMPIDRLRLEKFAVSSENQ